MAVGNSRLQQQTDFQLQQPDVGIKRSGPAVELASQMFACGKHNQSIVCSARCSSEGSAISREMLRLVHKHRSDLFFACPEIRETRIKDDGGALCLDQDMMGVLKRKDVGMFKDCRIWPKKKITSKDEYHQDFNGTATLTRLSCYF